MFNFVMFGRLKFTVIAEDSSIGPLQHVHITF